MSDVIISETCLCGASTTVTNVDRRDALDAIVEWRIGHRCNAKSLPLTSGAIGFGTRE
jgi:hypothetical protein